ncbi:hypothetical protein PCASD_16148 [Puccinia coronata f. sp. avenae]|uniref:Uncharacterized protein n=1 Tax=Puccinia coronata f. sp. avenae TaxID=200324 RepID=A0A2N5TAK8_9BASI|nr:hypothetical protein PCASD_16148 [Puccinia coronata f. sp. avenae]
MNLTTQDNQMALFQQPSSSIQSSTSITQSARESFPSTVSSCSLSTRCSSATTFPSPAMRHPSQIMTRQVCQHHLPTLDSTRGLDPAWTLFKMVLKDPPRILVSPGKCNGNSLHELGLPVREAAYPVVLLASTVSEIGRDGAKVMLNLRREEVRQAALKNLAIIQDTSSGHAATPGDWFRVGRTALLPAKTTCRSCSTELRLTCLSANKMAHFKLAAGLLKELHPWTHPQLLGVNWQNAGQSIGLRLLTKNPKSVPPFAMVRRVLNHKLQLNPEFNFGVTKPQYLFFHQLFFFCLFLVERKCKQMLSFFDNN